MTDILERGLEFYSERGGDYKWTGLGAVIAPGYHVGDIGSLDNPDYLVEPLNVKTNENTGVQETITVCKNSWSWDFLNNHAEAEDEYSCITVEYDEKSLRGYSADGFGANYCGENKAQIRDKLATGCFWGGIAGSVGVSLLSGGTLTMVALPIAIGSGSVLCEKILNMQDKWPHSQY